MRADPERLAKVLAAAGVASRRASEELIFGGRVTVNGAVCTVPQTPVDPLRDVIYIDGRSLPRRTASKLYFAVHKPKGYICSSASDGQRPVLQLFDGFLATWVAKNPGILRPRLFTVGRLDVATTGLLLVTNDGDFAQQVGHPSSGLSKEYIASVNERVSQRQLALMAAGAEVQGVRCVPASIDVLEAPSGGEGGRLRIVVNEGRNHEVRHIVAQAGVMVKNLRRVRIGGLRIPRSLGLGQYVQLTPKQVEAVLDAAAQENV
eukprot:SM000085S23190  [mRNA]  locus=s85:35241:38019:+ [translate_table: standard]